MHLLYVPHAEKVVVRTLLLVLVHDSHVQHAFFFPCDGMEVLWSTLEVLRAWCGVKVDFPHAHYSSKQLGKRLRKFASFCARLRTARFASSVRSTGIRLS